MAGPLTILFTNIWLDTYAGSEAVVRDLALGSLRRGHRPIVYTPELGKVAHELRGNGIAVCDDLRLIAEAPDIIHAHHAIPCAEALMRFPDVPAINVCHAFEIWIEAPAHFPQIGAYVAVDEACRDRLVHMHGIDPARVVVLPNAVDLRRVPPRPRPLSQRPRRAVAFGKASAAAQIRSACQALSIDFETIGSQVGREIPDPENELVKFDLVFASARAALEALCCGCAVIACDTRGMAGLVTSGNFSALRAKNFGVRSLTEPLTVERLIEEVSRYDREDTAAVCERARHEANLEGLLDAFEALYAEVLSGARRPPMSKAAHEAAVGQFLHDYLPRRPRDPRWPWLNERETLRGRVQDLENQLADAAHQLELHRAEARDATALVEKMRMEMQLASNELAKIKRSRLLKFRRWLRRIRGLPTPY